MPLTFNGQNLDEFNGVSLTNLSEVDGVAIANIAEINGVPVVTSTLKTDLVSVWELNETTGSTADDSYGTNDGYISVSVLKNQSGIIGTSFYFDDYADIVDVSDNSSFDNSGNFSISQWVYLAYSANSGRPFSTQDNSGGGTIWAFQYNAASEKISFLVRDSDANLQYATPESSNISTGGWYHIVGVKSGSTVDLFVNGLLSATVTGSFTGNFNPATNIYIGGYGQGSSEPWSGYVDQTACWKKALNAIEIGQLYNSGNGLAYTNW